MGFFCKDGNTQRIIATPEYRKNNIWKNLFYTIEDINEVAVHCNLSEFHFFRSFRQAYGITPYQFLLHKRLALADEFIRKGDMTITAVSAYCNFPDLFTFSKAYKRRFGVSPSQGRLHSL